MTDPIIDFHAHPMNQPINGMSWDNERALKVMSQANIDKMCLFNVGWQNVSHANKITAEIVQKYPDRFIGFAYINPRYKNAIRELQKTVQEFKFKGLKIYPNKCELPVKSEKWNTLFEYSEKNRLPVISHTQGEDKFCRPKLFGKVAEKHPELLLILGHSGNWHSGRQEAIKIAQKFPHVYLEISTSWREPGVIEELVSKVGADKVIFGSDFPLMDSRIHKGRILYADISTTDKEKILGKNAAKILNL